MATAELSVAPSSRQLLIELRRSWPRIYAGLWLSTLGSAVVVELMGHWLKAPVRDLLRARLDSRLNAPPSASHILLLVAHNLPICAWPVLLGAAGAHHHRAGRRLADLAVVGSVLANTVPTGAGLGAYGAPLVAYVPQLPLEWVALALGASAWRVQRRRPLRISGGLLIYGLTASALFGAAVLETFAVPHR